MDGALGVRACAGVSVGVMAMSSPVGRELLPGRVVEMGHERVPIPSECADHTDTRCPLRRGRSCPPAHVAPPEVVSPGCACGAMLPHPVAPVQAALHCAPAGVLGACGRCGSTKRPCMLPQRLSSPTSAIHGSAWYTSNPKNNARYPVRIAVHSGSHCATPMTSSSHPNPTTGTIA